MAHFFAAAAAAEVSLHAVKEEALNYLNFQLVSLVGALNQRVLLERCLPQPATFPLLISYLAADFLSPLLRAEHFALLGCLIYSGISVSSRSWFAPNGPSNLAAAAVAHNRRELCCLC